MISDMPHVQNSGPPDGDIVLHSLEDSFSLSRLDRNKIPEERDEVRVFGNIKNELLMLPYFFEYYRRIGIKRFFLVDDHSEDGSRDYCLGQPDVHLFVPSNSYAASSSGLRWQSLLLAKYGVGFWTLLVDADELLVFPHCEKVSLPQLCAFLDSKGHSALFSFLVDMYSKGPVSMAEYTTGQTFLEVCPYFDSDYQFLTLPDKQRYMPSAIWPPKSVRGGPRTRLFYPMQQGSDIFTRMLIKAAVMSGRALPFLYGDDRPHYAPALAKTILVKWKDGYERSSIHYMKKTKDISLANVTGALLHFKFFSGFFEKAFRESRRKQHFNGSQEYRRYLRYTRRHGEFSFFYSGSRQYKNSNSLLEAGLLFSTESYDNFAQKIE